MRRNYKNHLNGIDDSTILWIWKFNDGSGKKIYEHRAIDTSSNSIITITNPQWDPEIEPVTMCKEDCYFDGVHCRCTFY